MGFRNDGYLTVWEVKPTESRKVVNAKVSSRRKDRDTDSWRTDFSGWVKFIGRSAEAALKLKEKDRIVTKSIEVQNSYDKEKGRTYTDYIIWEFDMADGTRQSGKSAPVNIPGDAVVEEDDAPF